jgi:hypothetical protein
VWVMATTTKQNRNEWWSPSDLFFLKDALKRGMAFTEVAGFLCRDEDEVRKKAKQLKIPRRRHHRDLRRGE